MCGEPIDLRLHADTIDIDHVIPLKIGGKDDPQNFALTHNSCNRSKQDSDLRVARVLAHFDHIHHKVGGGNRAANRGDILAAFEGAQYDLPVNIEDKQVTYSLPDLGQNSIQPLPLFTDELSGFKYFFAKLPIEYLHHDSKTNPRAIGSNLKKLVKEFQRKRPQLHVALGWIETNGNDRSSIHLFDGQHKAAAQILLGARELPTRIFVNPDLDVLLTANTNAGTTLRQIAFDKSVQRNLGSVLLADRMDRYRKDRELPSDYEEFSEQDLVNHFKGESREMKKYVLDWVRSSITHHRDNKLEDYIEYGGRSTEMPFSYSTIEKTFYSFFISSDLLSTPFNFKMEEGDSPRQLEVDQVVHLMNLIAEELYVGQFDLTLGTRRIENRLKKGEDIPEPHLRAYRMAKEEIIYNWLRCIRQVVKMYFLKTGVFLTKNAPSRRPFPMQLGRIFVTSCAI
ncbi:MAG: HNH endonuclease [Planctomycetes bacterium]|nr:HNH endonuclease [Planctomycetota bacterium]